MPRRSLGLLAVLPLVVCACAARPVIIEDSPQHSASFSSNTVRFEWHAQAPGGEALVGYRLQVANNLSFSPPIHDQIYQEPSAEVILQPGTYYWRVQGRYRGMGDIIETTEWSDMKRLEGRAVQWARLVVVLDAGSLPPSALAAPAAPTAPPLPPGVAVATPAAAPPSAGAAAAAAGSTAARRPAPPGAAAPPRGGSEAVVAAHSNRPAFEGVDALGVGTIIVDGKEDVALTRELILQLYLLGRYTMLEQQLVGAGELRIPTSFLDQTGRPKEPPPEYARIFLLHPSQPTPMLSDDAVRLRSPDAMLLVRIGQLGFDPGALPRRPVQPAIPRPDFTRFGSGTRVCSATLVSVKTGIILWTTSLYGLPELPDMAMVSALVERYFR